MLLGGGKITRALSKVLDIRLLLWYSYAPNNRSQVLLCLVEIASISNSYSIQYGFA